jgi:hypothetical protein
MARAAKPGVEMRKRNRSNGGEDSDGLSDSAHGDEGHGRQKFWLLVV